MHQSAAKAKETPIPTQWAATRLRNVSDDAGLSARASLADFAPHLKRAIPWHIRLDRAWADLWAGCLETVDARAAL